MRGGSRGDDRDGDGVPIMVDAVSMDGQHRLRDLDNDIDADKYPFGFDLLLVGLDRFVSVLLHGPGAVDCADRFKNMSRDLISERTRVRRIEGGGVTKGPPNIFYSSSASADDVAIPAKGGTVMETTMTRGLRYLSFR